MSNQEQDANSPNCMSRRGFIGKTAVAASAFVTVSSDVSGSLVQAQPDDASHSRRGENAEGKRVTLKAGKLEGVLHDNASNADQDGAGFNPLRYTDYPNSSLYGPDKVGLNFEHIFNGMAKDHDPSFFTPRGDRNELVVHSENSASIRFAPEDCTWGMGSTMTYTLREPHYVDLTFRCTVHPEN